MTRLFNGITLLALVSFIYHPCFSQNAANLAVPVEKTANVDPNFIKLEKNNSWIRKDSILNEQLLDLVNVKEMDSILPNKTQHHRYGVGWFLYIFGYKWGGY